MDFYANTLSHAKRLPAFILFIPLLFLAGASYAQPFFNGNEPPSLAAEATALTPASGPELYARDFDPLQALPMPPAWRETEGFDDTADILSQRLATEEQVRVRVTLRLPAVERDRLDEAQGVNWDWEQAAVSEELLASLPTGTYEIKADPKVASSLLLDVQEASLEELMASDLVADVTLASIPAAFTNTRIDPPVRKSFGGTVRLSGDVALVTGSNSEFYLFRRTNGQWVEEKRVQVGETNFSIAIAGDLVAVGKPFTKPTGGYDYEGEITVYQWDGAYWNNISLSLPTEHRQAGANLGFSVALFGNTLVAGAPGWNLPYDNYGNSYSDVGRVYVWELQANGQWQFQAPIDNQREPIAARENDEFGSMVRLFGDTLLVHQCSYSRSNCIFDTRDRTGTSWNRAQPIPLSSNLTDLAFNGTFAVLGYGYNDSVEVWRRAGGKGTAFNLVNTLLAADDPPRNRFGTSLALSDNRLIVGAPNDTRGSLDSAGAAYVYRLTGAAWAWVPEVKVMANPAQYGDFFGDSVALSGNTLMMLAPGYDPSGTVYTYQLPNTLSIKDVTKAEGNSGDTPFTFTVSLSAASATPVTVQYATANGTAVAGSDYTPTSGTLTIPAGAISRTVTIQVKGDTALEANETFFVNLSVPNGATLTDAQGLGTINNDDIRNLRINDVSKAEGNSGTTPFTFTVSLNATSSAPVTVKYATANGTATAGSDYTTTSGTLTIPAGATSQTVTIQVKGDTAQEANETFFVNLSVPNGATLADAQGIGTINNDDIRNLRINDVSKAEGNSGTTPFTFTVSLNAISSAPVTVKYATANGTATAGSDYTATSGTLTIPADQISKTLTINIIGDTTNESQEQFFVNLSSPSGATLTDAQGVGIVTNDDGMAPDLIVTAITLNPTTPAANAAFSATVTVKNQGKTAASGGWLDVYTNQPTTPGCGTDGNKYQLVGTLAAGASKTFTFTGLSTRKATGRTFRAYVDSYCQTAEASEANNQSVKAY